ncbi:MAG TPA: CAP domain-containing protein, partial [Niastella sp.]
HTTPEGYGINYLINQSGYSLNGEWLKANNLSYFESIGSGQESGADAVKSLIIDEKDNNKGHRNHLLGITQWDASLYDIGIGFVKSDGSTYQSYTCIIIAKHK